MILFGAGGHAKVIISILRANGIVPKLIYDKNPNIAVLCGIPVTNPYDPQRYADAEVIVSIGDNRMRKIISEGISHRFGRAIHPTAILDDSITVGEGTVIMQGAMVQADALLGRHVIINTGASVDHDSSIGDFVHVAPGSVICGNVQVGDHTLVGAGSTVTQNLSIGKNCLITAGSVVTQSIPDGAIVRGNPARVLIIQN